MMAREFARVVERYGQTVTVYNQKAPEGMTLRAFFQPILDRGIAQGLPTPLGEARQDRFLYLGPPEAALEPGYGTGVEVDGELYRPQMVQGIYIAGTLSHWWAVLVHREQEVV